MRGVQASAESCKLAGDPGAFRLDMVLQPAASCDG